MAKSSPVSSSVHHSIAYYVSNVTSNITLGCYFYPIIPISISRFVFLCYSKLMVDSARSFQPHTSKRIFFFSLFSVVIVLIGGAVALLLQTHAASQADGVSVVGPPSLTASTVNAIFTRLGSPMAGTGTIVVQASRNTQVDDAFALAVWWTETNDGEAGTGRVYGDRNPAGVREGSGYPKDFGGYAIYPSYAAAIIYWFGMIRNNYVNRGLNTVYAISHPYVGTSSSPLWAAKVIRLMLRYRGEAPPPTAIPTLEPSPTVAPRPTVLPGVPGGNRKPKRQPEVNTRAFAKNSRVQPQSQSVQVSSVAHQAEYAGWIELSTMFFAVLAALALAIWAMRTVQAMRVRRIVFDTMPLRTTTALLPLAMAVPGVPTTEDLRMDVDIVGAGTCSINRHSTPLALHQGNRDTDPRVRRVTLLPSQPDEVLSTREAETVGVRQLGLLSRYKEMQQR